MSISVPSRFACLSLEDEEQRPKTKIAKNVKPKTIVANKTSKVGPFVSKKLSKSIEIVVRAMVRRLQVKKLARKLKSKRHNGRNGRKRTMN